MKDIVQLIVKRFDIVGILSNKEDALKYLKLCL